ncbi:MAG TPA: cation:proton antiporter [Patescibacteria group bacterium]|nr:cation:proton antiporter [Patescibacteria group bacterium]
MIAGAVGALYLICRHGETLAARRVVAALAESTAPAASTVPTAQAAGPVAAGAINRTEILVHVLMALAAVIVTGLVLAKGFAYLGQPPVIGEVVAGIVLGPSLLGPQISALILPPAVAPFLGVIAELGVVLYMFTIGLELRGDLVRGRAGAALAISHASIVVPFVLGALLALGLYPGLASGGARFTTFALFMGVAMSITAFPVLARILEDRGMMRSGLGGLALSCAATDDVTAWCLLAAVVGVARAHAGEGLRVAAGTLAFIAAMVLIVRPLARRIVARWEAPRPAASEPPTPTGADAPQPAAHALPPEAVALVFVALLLSALATEAIGIHAIFGAFLLGAVIPHDSAVARTFSTQLRPMVATLLLPAFFAFTGMRTRIDLLSGGGAWLVCGLIILVATVGKFGGTAIAARVAGLDWRSASALGALMNTRGLMELIVLNVGLDLGVISPALFAMMVLMAIVTTMLTSPAVRLLVPAAADRAAAPAR